MWRDIKRLIHDHSRFVLTTHVNPDGDGIGAATALIELLRQMGKEGRLVCDSPIPPQFSFLNVHGLHGEYDVNDPYEGVEVVILLDVHRLERIGRVAELIGRPDVEAVIIDHHIPTYIFTSHAAIDVEACCVGTMVYTLYKECGFDLTLPAAHGIYTSILCDTGRFCYSSTSRKAHKIADECIRLGVNPDQMFSRLFQHLSLPELKMFARSLQHMETHFDNRVLVQEIRKEDYQDLGEGAIDIEHVELDYIFDFHYQLEKVVCFLLLRELKTGQIRVSIRSRGEYDVSQLMRGFGGGGHCNAAGALVVGTLAEVKAAILSVMTLS